MSARSQKSRHSRAGGNPVLQFEHRWKPENWIPAFAGMTNVDGEHRP